MSHGITTSLWEWGFAINKSQSEECSIVNRFCRRTSFKNSTDFIQLPSCRMWDLLVTSGKATLSQESIDVIFEIRNGHIMYADWGRYFSLYGGGPASLFMKMSHSVVNKTTSVNRLRLPYSSGPQQHDLHNLHLTEHHRHCSCKHLSHCDSRSLLLIQCKQYLCALIVIPLVERLILMFRLQSSPSYIAIAAQLHFWFHLA